MDKRGQWWQKLSDEERSAIRRKAARSRKRNELNRTKDKSTDQDINNLMVVVSKIGVKKSLAILNACKEL